MSSVYLLLGPEEGHKKEFANKIIASLSQKETLDTRKFFAGVDPLSELLNFLQTPSLFGDFPIAQLWGINSLGKKELNLLRDYCLNTKQDSCLFLLDQAVSTDKKLEANVLKNRSPSNKRIFWEMFDSDKAPWIRHKCAEHGYKIDQGAVELILELVENQSEELLKALQVIILNNKTSTNIDYDMAEEALFHSKHESIFTLFDKFTNRNIEACFEILQVMLLASQDKPVMIFSGLSRQIKRLLAISSSLELSMPLKDACRNHGVSSKRAITSYNAGINNFTVAELQKIVKKLGRYDNELRGAGRLTKISLQFFIWDCLNSK